MSESDVAKGTNRQTDPAKMLFSAKSIFRCPIPASLLYDVYNFPDHFIMSSWFLQMSLCLQMHDGNEAFRVGILAGSVVCHL